MTTFERVGWFFCPTQNNFSMISPADAVGNADRGEHRYCQPDHKAIYTSEIEARKVIQSGLDPEFKVSDLKSGDNVLVKAEYYRSGATPNIKLRFPGGDWRTPMQVRPEDIIGRAEPMTPVEPRLLLDNEFIRDSEGDNWRPTNGLWSRIGRNNAFYGYTIDWENLNKRYGPLTLYIGKEIK